MKKKILITSLLLGSAISILPFSLISKNVINKMENDPIEEEINSNTLNLKDSANANVFYDKNYTSAYINNLTKPVISPDKNVTGFLGAWTTDIIDQFPTAIGWTTPNLFQSWSVNLEDHPSLKNSSVPSNFTPGLVTALYSDNKYSKNNRNQIFAVVANTADLDARRYWILRYNAVDGSPIKDDNAEMPKMANAPLPEMSRNNGNGSAFALTTDALNDRYIAFYPGRLGDLKNDIFGFKITSDNKIEWLENNKSFSGHKNWNNDLSATAFTDYKDDNFVLGLAPFNTKKSINGAGMTLMIATTDTFDQDKDNWYFRILDLKDDFSAIKDFNTLVLKGRTAGIFNGTEDIIKVPKSLLSLAEVQRNINPHLQLFDFIDNIGNSTHKVQMIVPIKNGDEWIYMYLSGIFDNANKWYLTSWGTNGTLSQGSFFSSSAVEGMPPGISYNDENVNDIIITYHPSRTEILRVTAETFKFDTLPNNGPWDPKISFLANQTINNLNSNWKPKNVAFRLPNNQEFFIWSLQGGQTTSYITYKNGASEPMSRITSGGIKHEDFQSTAAELKWLPNNGEGGRFPSQISNSDLQTIGTDSSNFFRIPEISYPNTFKFDISITLDGEPIRDDSKGTLKGIFNLREFVSTGGETTETTSKVPFEITGLNIKGDAPTSINQNNSILNNLPSDLTPENVPNFIDVIATPTDQGDIEITEWEVTDQNNADGTATVSVKIVPYYDADGKLVTDPAKAEKISTNVSGLKKLSGTSAIQSSANISDLTVWDIDDKIAENLVEINDLIPGSPTNDIKYSVKDQAPLTGELTVAVSIPAGSYYDPANKGLPTTIGGNPLEIPVKITGAKTIPDTGTLVIPRNGEYPGIFPAFIDADNAPQFFDISNAVPKSSYTIDKTSFVVDRGDTNTPFSGKVSFDLKFDREYRKDGTIDESPAKKTVTIEGFEPGFEPNNTLALPTLNRDLYSNTLAPEINETNIDKFIVLVNLPDDAEVTYKFTNQRNTGPSNTGSLTVEITISKHFDNSGTLIENDPKLYTITINGLKTIDGPTEVKVLEGLSDTLPQNISQVDIPKFYTILNPSPIIGKPTSIEIKEGSIIRDNINGIITLQYKLINAVKVSEFVEESDYATLRIAGFQKGSITSVKQKGNFEDKKASEFILDLNNFSTYAELVGYTIKFTDEEGNTAGTNVTKVEKISFDDNKGIATFKATIVDGAINQDGIFTLDEVEITFQFDGFETVVPEDNTIWIIVGAVGGGILLLILIVAIIMIVNSRKNKKILNDKSKKPTTSAPPSNSGTARPVTPTPTVSLGPSVPTPSQKK